MEAVKPLGETPEEQPIDTRTDLEELDDLVLEMRDLRRMKDNIVKKELRRCMTGKKIKMVGEDISFEISALHKTYAYLEKSYCSLMKICFPKGLKQQPQGAMVNMDAVKEKPSTMGEIVRSTRENNV